jgi:hypothetical protein
MILKTWMAGFAVASLLLADAAAGINWTTPASWKTAGDRPMRAATYTVPAAAGDKEPGECVVNYFGQGQGGGVQANIDRWVGQFQQANGKPSKEVAKIGKKTIHGLNVTTVDVTGTYSGMGGPMAASHTPMPGYRMLAAIVEAPQGAVFFKFTGPAKTVAAQQATFDQLLNSLKK